MRWRIEQEKDGHWHELAVCDTEEEARQHAQALRSLMDMGLTPDAAVRIGPVEQ